ncbi:MAG: hypothetical protein ACI9CU_001822 [Polaribacter sp.]|jgi:hypothetical protein
MKTLRLLVAVGLLVGSYSMGMAQSNSSSISGPDNKPVEVSIRETGVKAAQVKPNAQTTKADAKVAKQISPEEKRALGKNYNKQAVRTEIKVTSNMKIAGKVDSAGQLKAAQKDAAAKKELESKKVKSTTPKK